MFSITLWNSITNLGNSGLMLPVAGMIAAWLVAGGAWRLACWWLLFFGLAVAITLATKIAFLGWGIGIQSLNFTGFSGHTMLATAIYPTSAHLILRNKPRKLRLLGIALGLCIGVLVGVSRYEMGAHSLSEVIAGFLLGTLVSLVLTKSSHRMNKPVLSGFFLCIPIIGMVFYSYQGHQMEAHRYVIQLALKLSGHSQPYSREMWDI